MSMTMEDAGSCIYLGAGIMGIVYSVAIIVSHKRSWCKWCKQRHNPKHFDSDPQKSGGHDVTE